MKSLLVAGALVSMALPGVAQTTTARTTKVTPLFSHDLTGIAGKEGALIMVEYRPERRTPSTGTTRTFSSTCSKARSSCR